MFVMINTRTNYIDLARFVGIYAVVLGHFTPFESIADGIGRELIYMFHVPLFFLISGMLSKPTSPIKVFYSLIIPYFIYNVISIAKLDIIPLITFNALELNNAPTWFFAALFFIKIISDNVNNAIPVYIGIIIFVVTILYYSDIGISRFMGLHAVVYGLPFFLFGKFLKDKMSFVVSARIYFWIPCAIILFFVFMYYERFDLYSSEIHNPLVYFFTSCMASLLILVLCSKLFVYIPKSFYDFIRVNGRGSMFILGTHYILLGVLSKYIIPDVQIDFLLKMLIVALLSVPYYFLIKYTYNKFPVLYGKMCYSLLRK